MNETTAILQLLLAKGLGTRTLSRLLRTLSSRQVSPGDFVECSVTEMVVSFGVKPDAASAIPLARDSALAVAEELDEHRISLVHLAGKEYPARLLRVLGDDAPPVLFVKGDTSILEKKAVGFCGSRKASEKGIRIAHDAAYQLAERGVNVVSGYAHGVDLASHRGAVESGGVTTLVLAEGILKFSMKAELAELLEERNYLIVSEFSPKLPWIARNAMQRNRTICGLANAMILVESRANGGTFAAGEDTLRLGQPLFVVEYANNSDASEGNRHFLKRGAHALRGNKAGTPNLTDVLSTIEDEQHTEKPTDSLFEESPVTSVAQCR